MANIKISQKRAYVYAIFVDGVVRYIGKGTGTRFARHMHIARQYMTGEKTRPTLFYRKLVASIRRRAEIKTRILIAGLTDADAFAREVYEIASYPKGHLWNGTEGGDGFTSVTARKAWKIMSAKPENIRRQKQATSEMMKHRWAEEREKQLAAVIAGMAKPEAKAKRAKATKAAWADLRSRKRRIRGMRRAMTEEARSQRSRAAQIVMSTPTRRAQSSEVMRQLRKTKKMKKILADLMTSNAYRAKMSATMREWWAKRRGV